MSWRTVWVFLLLTLSASIAHADAAFEECQKTYDGGRFQEAYICYKKGYEKTPNFMWAANLGNVEVKLGKYKDAIPHLEFALEHVDAGSPNAELTRQRLRAKIAEATAQVAVVTLSLTPANTQGASVAINGNVVGITPLAEPIILDAGNYKLTATHPQFEDLSYDLVAQPNTTPTLNLQMTPRAGGGGGDEGVSGAMIGVAVAGGVLALGAIGAGIGLFVAAGSKSSEREDIATDLGDTTVCSDPTTTDPRCSQIQDLADDENTFTAAGTAMLIVGGVLAAGTVVAVILWPSSSSDTGLWIAPGPTSLHVGGTF